MPGDKEPERFFLLAQLLGFGPFAVAFEAEFFGLAATGPAEQVVLICMAGGDPGPAQNALERCSH